MKIKVHPLSFYLILIVFTTSGIQAQSWNTVSSMDSLATNEGLFGLTSMYGFEERIMITSLKGDFTYGIFYSDDNGATWVESASDEVTAAYSAFSNTIDSTIYVVGSDLFANKVIRKSVNGGADWTNIQADFTVPGLGFAPSHLEVIGDTILASSATRNTGIYKSVDEGATWTALDTFSDTDDNKSIVQVFSKGSYFYAAIGTNGRGLFKSHRDSTRWVPVLQVGEINTGVYGATVLSNGRLIFISSEGIHYSDNDGESWDLKTLNDLGFDVSGTVWGVDYYKDRVMVAFISGDTTNSEIYLVNEDLSGSEDITTGLENYFNDTRLILTATNNNGIYAKRMNEELNLYSLLFEGTSVSSEIENEVTTQFQLDQNYPNPFNPSTNINFNLPESGLLTLKVYNLLGQEIAELVNGRMVSGSHSINFDASGLSSGVYIYRLQAGNEVQTKKMMLIK